MQDNSLFKVYYHTQQYAFHTSGCKQTYVQSFIAYSFALADKEMKGNGLG